MNQCPVTGRVYPATRPCKERGEFRTQLETLNLPFFSWCRFLCTSSSAVSPPYITKLFRIAVTVWRSRAIVTKYWLVVSLYICLLTVICNDISRNTVQGTGSTTARIGGVSAPYIALVVGVNCCYPVHFRRLR